MVRDGYLHVNYSIKLSMVSNMDPTINVFTYKRKI